MGYYIQQRDSDFHITASNKDGALQAIKNLLDDGNVGVDESVIANATTLSEAMDEWNWSLEEEDNGDIHSIIFSGEKSRNEDFVLKTIAPFVEKDSYIEMEGEEGERFRWTFNGTTCTEVYPTIIWP